MKGSSSGFGFGSRVPSSLMVNTWKNENNNRSVKDHEDLTLFREMNNRNRDKDGVISLLHPLSDEFDHSLIPLPNPNVDLVLHAAGTGSDQLYRIPSSKKGSISAIDFLAENDKNDYDWLKTPPATPLFPSIEMEATATDGPQLIIPTQREIPILHPLSRFVDGNNNREVSGRTSNISGIQKSLFKKPKPKPKPTPTPEVPAAAVAVPAPAPTMHKSSVPTLVPVLKNTSTSNKESHNFDKSNSNTKLNTTKPMMMRSSRAVSPLVRSTILISELLSNETPPNLRTSVADDQRSASAMRGRATTPTAKPRRQSCSPSVTRGRKQQPHPHEATTVRTASTKDQEINNNNNNKGGRGVVGSRMVDKLMNARRSSANTTTTTTTTTSSRDRDRFKDTKPNYSRPNLLTTTTTTTTRDQVQSRSNSLGFGRMAISKTTDYKSVIDTKRGLIIN